MRTKRSAVCILFILLLTASPVWSVRSPTGAPTLPAPPPALHQITGPVTATPSEWSPQPARALAAEAWQSYCYNSSGFIALTAGAPMPLTDEVADEPAMVDAAIEFVSLNSEALGLEGCDLVVASVRNVNGLTVIHLQPVVDGVPVYGGYVVLSLNHDGALALLKARGFGARTSGRFSLSAGEAESSARRALGGLQGEATVERYCLPRSGDDGGITLRCCCLVTIIAADPELRPTLFIDGETGRVLAAENRVCYDRLEGLVEGYYKPRYGRDAPELAPFIHDRVNLEGGGSVFSDRDGEFGFEVDPDNAPFTLNSELRGRYVDVDYEDGQDARYRLEVDRVEPVEMTWGANRARDDERTLYYHVNFIHDFWTDLDNDFDGLDYPMPAVCQHREGYANAYWNGHGVYFGDGGHDRDNFALYADIIYHEYGHGVTSVIYPWNVLPYYGESGALNEAWSDYFPCSITDEPLMGEGGLTAGYIRNLDNDLHYPEDIRDEVHLDSRIISAAMWHSREVLGRELADSLFHFARYELGNNFLLYFADVLLTDDDDGDITNGTPHDETLYEQFGRHGIGPGINPKIRFVRVELFDDDQGGAHGNGDRVWESGETVRIGIDLYRDGFLFPPPARDVRVNLEADHPDLRIEHAGIGFGDMRVGDRRTGQGELLFSIGEEAPLSFANLYLSVVAADSEVVKRDTLRVPIGRPDVLLVRDGDDARDYTCWLVDALDEIGVIYDRFVTAEPHMSLDQRLSGDIQSVIWFTGSARSGILTPDSRAALSEFLDAGGNLLLTGQSAGSAAGVEPFFNQYIGARHIIDSLGADYVEGVPDDPVAQGMALLMRGSWGAQNLRRPGAMVAIRPAVEIYHWAWIEGCPAAGVRRQDPVTGARTVYYSFGLEAVGGHGGTNTRAEAISAVLSWFGVLTSVEEGVTAPGRFLLQAPYPNPTNGMLRIPFQLTRPGRVTVSLFDLTGREVWSGSGELEPGKVVWSIPAEIWGSGVYLIQVTTQEGSGSVRAVLAK